MRTLKKLLPKLLTVRNIDQVDAQLAKALSLDPNRHTSIALITCDQDDSLYAALDHATKYAEVDVVYAKSFYAGSAHASGPLSGEVLGILAGANPSEVAEGVWALREAIENKIHFVTFDGGDPAPAFFPHVISESGRYLSQLAGVRVGAPLAYLIAPPTEALVGLDAALKAANVELKKFFGPPTETNFAGGYLTGALPDVEEAARAFTDAIERVVASPLGGMVRPERERR
jgi:ethanolamine utilization protein EutL